MKQNLDQITNGLNIELIKKITDETSDSKYKDEILHNRMEEKHNPNFNYLCCVVKEKMKDRKIEYMLDDNIVELIACNCRNNEDIIERIVTALWASNEIEKTINYTPEIILERVIEYLILDLREIDNSIIINIIKEVVANKYGITTEDLISRSKAPEILYPRKIAMYLCRLLTNAYVPTISRKHFGDRDPILLLDICEQIAEDLTNNPTLVSEINDIISQVDISLKSGFKS